MYAIETVGGTTVSSGCWGEDSRHELAGAVHSRVASPALTRIFSREPYQTRGFSFCFFPAENLFSKQ